MPSVQVSRRPARQSTAADGRWSTAGGSNFTAGSAGGSNFTTQTKEPWSPTAGSQQPASPSTNRPPSPVHQSALKHQPYLYKLVADVDRMRSGGRHDQRFGAEASASDASSIAAQSGRQRTAYQSRMARTSTTGRHGASDPVSPECFPPPPSAEELRSIDRQSSVDDGSNSGRLQSGYHGNRLYKSPFLTGSFLSTAQSSLPSQSTEPRAKQLQGKTSDNKAAATRSGSLGSKVSSARTSTGQRSPAGNSAAADANDAIGRDDKWTAGNSTGLSLSTSGVKPASHHEPSRHTYVLCTV